MDVRARHLAFLQMQFQCEFAIADFEADEKELLLKYGSWLNALMCGYIQPFTEAQEHFVGVCQGTSTPETPVEKAWFRYRVELMYRSALAAEENVGADLTYKKLRQHFARIARLGHVGAIEWMNREGPWSEVPSASQSSYAKRTFFNQPYKLHFVDPVSGSFGLKYDFGQEPIA